MAAPTIWYVNGLRTCMRAGMGIAGVTGTLKMAFLSSAYVLDQDAHDFFNDVSAVQVTGTGVPAGGLTIGSPTVTVDGPTNTAYLDFTDPTGINVTACYGVLYVDTGSTATSPLLCVTDFSEGDATDQVITSAVLAANGYAALVAA
jgi:hypothetical protein